MLVHCTAAACISAASAASYRLLRQLHTQRRGRHGALPLLRRLHLMKLIETDTVVLYSSSA